MEKPKPWSPNFMDGDFPFDEIRQESGDYFDSIDQARSAGYADSQIWSVCCHDDEWVYGPPFHWVNLIGYIATLEHHDRMTYYTEIVPDNYDEPTEAEEWHSFDPDC